MPGPVRDFPEKFLVAFSLAGEQRDLVRSIAAALEERLGRSTVFLDEWYEYYIAGADSDLTLQKIYREQSALAVVCVSAAYGSKPWTRAEHDAIRERVNRSRASGSEEDQHGVLPIRVGDGDVEGITFNTIVPDVRPSKKSLDETVELILGRLRLVDPNSQHAEASAVRPAWPHEPIPFEHRLADRTEQWPAIQQFMTEGSANRILIFKGPSNYSKSALLKAAARYAKILGVVTAYVDFKDTQLLHQSNVLERLRLDLGAILPSFAADMEPKPWKLLSALRQLSSPALILLDTYEKVTDTKELVEWIELQMLPEVEQCTQVRFLIGGQKVPARDTLWRDLAEEIELDRINDQRVWCEWIQQRNPHVDDKHVESIVGGLEGVPGTISTVLTTFAKTRGPAG